MEDGLIEEEAVIDRRAQDGKAQKTHQAQDGAGVEPDERTGLLDGQRSDGTEDSSDESAWHGDRDFRGLPWWKRPSIYWMLPAFALYTLAFGGVLVPRINLITDLVCRDYLADKMFMDPHYNPNPSTNPECSGRIVSGKAAVFLMGDNVLGGLLSAVVSPYLGKLSDRVGRKPMMIFTSIGALVKELTGIFAATYPATFPKGLFYLGFIADGLCGTFIAGLAIAHSYATDCTPPHKRNVAFGFFQGMLFAGIGLGPLIAGFIIKATGTVLTMFYIALACHLIFIFNLLFIVPESLSKRRREESKEKHRIAQMKMDPSNRGLVKDMMRAVGSDVLEPLKVLWPTGEGSSAIVRRNLVLLCSIDTVMFGVAMGAMSVLILYVRTRFGWGNLEQSEYVSVVNITRVACLFLVLPVITRLLRGPKSKRRNDTQDGCDWIDLLIIRVSVLIDMLGFLGYTLAQTGPVFIFSGCIAALGGIASPTLQSSLTKHVPADKTGALLGASAMLHALARVIAPLIFSTIYYKTVETYIQAVFLCLTITFGCAWILTLFLKPGVFVDDPDRPPASMSESAADEGQVGRL